MITVSSLPPNEIDADTARRTADAVLDGPDFAGLDESPIALARRWVIERIIDVLDTIVGTDGASTVGGIVLIIVVVAGLVLLVRFGRGVRRDPHAELVFTSQGRDPTSWELEAAAHRAAGRLRDAVMARHHALVARLETAGIVESSSVGRTAAEVAKGASTIRPDLAEALADLTEVFEVAVYAHAPPSVTDVDTLDAACAAVEQRATRRQVPAVSGPGAQQ